LGLNEIAVTVDIAEYRNKEKLWSRDVIWRAAVSVSDLSVSPDPESSDSDIDFVCYLLNLKMKYSRTTVQVCE
jgi:hypothetical protein